MARSKSLFDRMLASSLPLVPKPIVRKVASRYVAGETLDEAVARCKAINEKGARVTVDVLGEEISDIAAGEQAVTDYVQLIDRMQAEGLDGNVSVKLTAFGLKIDPEVTYQRLKKVVTHAAAHENWVRIDMEDSSVTTETLEAYRRLRAEGHDNCGAVLQAYMRRSMQDVADDAHLEPSYRLCKGIYIEPEDIAFQGYDEINGNYMALLESMFATSSHVGIATHDHALVERSVALLNQLGVPKDRYEFQMLLGVDATLAQRLLDEGHKLRIYVPFGVDWYAYCIRRLKENPRIGRYVLFGMFKK